MTKATMSGLLAALLVAATVPATAAQREHGVNQRQHQQHQRIQKGARQGDLTRNEARGLREQSREIRREEHAFRSDGRFTPAERRHVQRDLDRQSRDIHRERGDGDRRDGRHAGFDRHPAPSGHPGRDRGNHYGWDRAQHHGWDRAQRNGRIASTRAFDRRYDHAQFEQRQRIERSVRSGELTRREAGRLWEEQRALEAQERRYLADGSLTRAERADMLQDLNAQGRLIYNEAHDAQSRR